MSKAFFDGFWNKICMRTGLPPCWGPLALVRLLSDNKKTPMRWGAKAFSIICSGAFISLRRGEIRLNDEGSRRCGAGAMFGGINR